MTRYRVNVEEIYSFEYEFDADDEQSAKEKAYNMWLDEGHAYDVDEVRLSTTVVNDRSNPT